MRNLKRDFAVLLVIVLTVLTGCHARLLMPVQDQYAVPGVSELKAAPVVHAVFFLNPALDYAEAGEGRLSWKAVLIPLDADSKEESYLAVDFDNKDWNACMKKLSIIMPFRNGQAPKGLLGVVNHDGTKIFNQRAEFREIINPRKALKAADYRDFLPEVDLNKPFFEVIQPGSEKFKAMEERYLAFAIRGLEKKLDYVYGTYGTNRTPAEWRAIAMKDDTVRSVIDALTSKLSGFIFLPFNPSGTAVSFGIMKLIDIAAIWDNRIKNIPGFSNYMPNMWDIGLSNARTYFYPVCQTLHYMKSLQK